MKNYFFTCLLVCMASTSMAEVCPTGYYNAVYGKKDAALKTAISGVIRPHTAITYGSGSCTNKTWGVFYYADQDEDGYCMDMYCDDWVQFGNCGQAIASCNIEHSFAKSWWGGDNNDAYKDCYHLNPSNSDANSARSSYPLGVPTTNIKDSGTGSLKVGKAMYAGQTFWVFEPKDEYKGDFARAYFYMVTCYGEELTWVTNQSSIGSYYAMRDADDANAYLEFQDWEIEVLLKWHRQDTVSEKEIKRMDAVSNFQHNRNPYIDHPEWVEYIWGNKKGQILTNTIEDDENDENDAYTVAEAKSAYDQGTIVKDDSIRIIGYITNISIKPNNFSKFHSANIWISDSQGTSQDFELYNCQGMNKVQFSTFDPYQATGTSFLNVNSVTDVSGNVFCIGDRIEATGKISLFNSTYELQQDCYIIRKMDAPKVEVSIKLPTSWDTPAVYSWNDYTKQVSAMTCYRTNGGYNWWKGLVSTTASGFLFKNVVDQDTWTLQTVDITVPTEATCYELGTYSNVYSVNAADCEVLITVQSANTSQGVVFGSGIYTINSNVLIAASAFEGYRIDYWSDGNRAAARRFNATEDIQLTAYFTTDKTDTVMVHDTTYVSMIEVNSMNPMMGTAILQAAAVPETGYQFLQWTDFNTENPREIEISDQPQSFTAVFTAAGPATTQRVQAAEEKNATKRIVNNHLIIERNGKAYDARGRKL